MKGNKKLEAIMAKKENGYKAYAEKDDTLKGKWNVIIQKGDQWWAVLLGTEKKCKELAEELQQGFDYIESK
jgi:hypothetical protein